MPAYYNEIEPFAAEWLRNLIAAGLIPPGDVDDRDIREVSPDDLKGYDQCHFFAGVGGWSYALRLAGWPDDRAVWTGSCPCQPLSSAGQRKGHADRRHLWPSFFRLIAERHPATVFGEQVASPLGREWFAGVRADLEHLGYACGAADLPAACVGAPHIRQRLWWVADANRDDRHPAQGFSHTEADGRNLARGRGRDGGLADAQRGAAKRPGHQVAGAARAAGRKIRKQRLRAHPRDGSATVRLGDPDDQPTEAVRAVQAGQRPTPPRRGTRQRPGAGREDRPQAGTDRRVGDASVSGDRSLDGEPGSSTEPQEPDRGPGLPRGLGDADGPTTERQRQDGVSMESEQATGRSGGANPWASSALIGCADGQARRVEPSIQPLAHGVPARVGRLRAYGNAIVPQVAAVFIRAFVEGRTVE